jgi:hypothetical protein
MAPKLRKVEPVAIGNPRLASGGSINFLEKWSQSGNWPDLTSIQAKLPLENPLEREISPLDAPKEKRKPRQGRENLSGPVPLRKSGPMFRKAKALLDVCQIADALIEVEIGNETHWMRRLNRNERNRFR